MRFLIDLINIIDYFLDPDILMEPSAQPAVYGETYDRETDGSRATGKQQTIFHSFILGTITITITITLLVLF